MTQQEEIQYIQSIIDDAPLSKAKRDKANQCLHGILQKYSAEIQKMQQELEKLKENDVARRKAAKNKREVPAQD